MPKEEIDKNSHYHIDMFVSTIVWIRCWINNRANLSLADDQDDICDQQDIEYIGQRVSSIH